MTMWNRITILCRDGCDSCSSQLQFQPCDIPAPVSQSCSVPHWIFPGTQQAHQEERGAHHCSIRADFTGYSGIHQEPMLGSPSQALFSQYLPFLLNPLSYSEQQHRSLPHYLGRNHRPFSTHKPHHPTSTTLQHSEGCQAQSVLLQPCVPIFPPPITYGCSTALSHLDY